MAENQQELRYIEITTYDELYKETEELYEFIKLVRRLNPSSCLHALAMVTSKIIKEQSASDEDAVDNLKSFLINLNREIHRKVH